jgi:3-isopropylmalate/(R)-2-methylmalate dehydratase large subunit
MPETFAQKVLGAKVGRPVGVGEIVVAEPDVVLSHDNSAAISKTFARLGVSRVKYPDRLVIVLDHCVPPADEKHARNHKTVREFVRAQGIKHFYDLNHGVCHQVLAEMGHVRPGMLVIGSDSHTTTHGALGAFAVGVGRTEAASAWAVGDLWLLVPETLRIEVNGRFHKHVGPKDLMLKVIGDVGSDGALYRSVEFDGEAVRAMDVGDRMVLCNLAAEMGAKNGYVTADDKVKEYLAWADGADVSAVSSDADCEYSSLLKYDAAGIDPGVAKPHTVDNYAPVRDVAGTHIDVALLGTCTNGRLSDLKAAADILKGKRVKPGTRLLVFPASMRVYREAMTAGVLDALIEAGGVIMNPGCGPCLGAHEGVLAPGEVALSTANRNFKGRMGCNEAEVYLAGPETVAASAAAGEITDPREVD